MIKVVTLCIIIFAVSAFFISDAKIIGWAVLALGLFCLVSLEFFKIPIKNVWPDIVFAVIGGSIAGVAGAIIGGVVGNAITDGIAGVFEGDMAERLRESNISESRTMLGSSVGKMAGCLLGAGVVLIIANLINPTL
ncbi:MAG: hypothetical protein US00_C0003G0055 [Candidatus Nomurabacteria bacterium GW2011_GWF2_36_126]|nr:MAG: hypothetical protein US00_C0003G0055 [Candidatus Nomurabacteria bacterium GW2011_GWF2_36_126]